MLKQIGIWFLTILSGSIGCIAHGQIVDSREGGWAGGDASMVCRHRGTVYGLSILNGLPQMIRDGALVSFKKTTMLPVGFGMSFIDDETFYTVIARFDDGIIQVTSSPLGDNARKIPEWIIVSCDPCVNPVSNVEVEMGEFQLTIPGEDWCLLRNPSDTMVQIFLRSTRGRDERTNMDNLIDDAEVSNILIVFANVGDGSEVSPVINSVSALNSFAEASVAKPDGSWAERGPWAINFLSSGGGLPDYKLLDIKMARYATEKRPCARVETEMVKEGATPRIFSDVRLACIGGSGSGQLLGIRFANTRAPGDPKDVELKRRARALADALDNSITLH